jgi:hypothetical protein
MLIAELDVNLHLELVQLIASLLRKPPRHQANRRQRSQRMDLAVGKLVSPVQVARMVIAAAGMDGGKSITCLRSLFTAETNAFYSGSVDAYCQKSKGCQSDFGTCT